MTRDRELQSGPSWLRRERLIEQAEPGHSPGQGVLGPHVSLDAWRAITTVAGRLTPLQAKLALAGLKPYVERDPGRYRYHDDEHVRIICAIHDSQPDLRTQARDHLLACSSRTRMLPRPQPGGRLPVRRRT